MTIGRRKYCPTWLWFVVIIFSDKLQSACVLAPEDFRVLKSNVASKSSDRAYLASLERAACSYEAGTKWVVKENPLALSVAEYVSSAIYQKILGKECVGDTIWVHDREKNLGYIATQFKDKFWKFPGRFRPGQNDVKNFEFYDAFNDLWLLDGISGPVLRKLPENSDDRSLKPIEGVELATLASLFLDEADYEDGWNFALVETLEKFRVTRYDFDGSLKFLERLGHSKGRNSPRGIDFSAGAGTRYLEPSWEKLENYYTPYNQPVNGPKMLNAMRHLTSMPMAEIVEIVQQRYSEISPYVTNQAFDESFLVADMEFLSSITKKILGERHEALEQMQLCLELEMAIENNWADKMRELIRDQGKEINAQLQCTFILKKSLDSQFESGALAKIVRRVNKAAAVLLGSINGEKKTDL